MASGADQVPVHPSLAFINTGFENASPLNWTVNEDRTIRIELIYDHERSSPNRANGHWHFQLQGKAGSNVTLLLENFENVWNGQVASPIRERSSCYVSDDGIVWKVIPAKRTEGNRLRVDVPMNHDTVYVARMEPYRLSDLERLLAEIEGHPLVEITAIGKTVEGRELEMIRIGSADAPYRVLLRARAHAWEAGGNWVVQGMIRRLLRDDEAARRYRRRYRIDVMPMANKDGVVRGYTRFNVNGMDLNRKWDRMSDPAYAPEKYALETWLDSMLDREQLPHLAIDFHNDNGGNIHISRPNINLDRYLANMERFERLLREHTWFTEGSTGSGFRNPGSFGEGLLERYGIDAFVYELNCDWIEGLKKVPFGADWELLGEDLCEVFYLYFEPQE